jgi:hypothetical protein
MLLFLACTGPVEDTAPRFVDWSNSRPPLQAEAQGKSWKRGLIHSHSPLSHDACDGDGLPDGQVNEPCLADLRAAVCELSMDFIYLTDHPSNAADQDYETTKLLREDDEDLGIATRLACGTTLMPGYEDDLMPVGMESKMADRETYDNDDADAIAQMKAAGGIVLSAHTEGRDLDQLRERMENGAAGFEIFNLHAMFDPNIREEDLDLDRLSWMEEMDIFTAGDATPDLYFLVVHQEQAPSIEAFDTLWLDFDVVGTGGTDAHQNVLNLEMADGERVDSYRRMMSWFSNWLLTDGDTPAHFDEALAAGRNAVVFEVLGTPDTLDVSVEGDTLKVHCPSLTATSPWDGEAPEITVDVFKDGVPWKTGCGTHDVGGAGVYRVAYTITPHHLAGFVPAEFIRPYPWIYMPPVRVR